MPKIKRSKKVRQRSKLGGVAVEEGITGKTEDAKIDELIPSEFLKGKSNAPSIEPNQETKTKGLTGKKKTKKEKLQDKRKKLLNRLSLPPEIGKHPNFKTGSPFSFESVKDVLPNCLALSGALPSKEQFVEKKKNSSKKINLNEIRMYSAALTHPAFQKNPIWAISTHVDNVSKQKAQSSNNC